MNAEIPNYSTTVQKKMLFLQYERKIVEVYSRK